MIKWIYGYHFVGKLRWQVYTNWIGNWDLPLPASPNMSGLPTAHNRWARDQGVMAKNLVHSNADQTSHWICILRTGRTCAIDTYSCKPWNRLKQHHNLSPGSVKAPCSANHKQNPSIEKLTLHLWINDLEISSFKQSKQMSCFCSFFQTTSPFLPRSRIHPEGFESSRIQNRHVVGGGPRYHHRGWRLSFLGPAMLGGV